MRRMYANANCNFSNFWSNWSSVVILNYIETDEIGDYLSLKIYYTKNLKTNTKCSENFSSVYLKAIIWNMKLEI